MRLEFVRVSSDAGQPLFMVWNPDHESFEEYSGATRWDSWQEFIADLRESLAARPAHEVLPGESEEDREEYEDDSRRRLDDAIHRFERAAPHFIKQAGKPQPAAPSKRSVLLGNIGCWSFGVLFLVILGSGLWTSALHPLLGWMGLVEYTSPTQRRYDRFLLTVASCRSAREVSTGRSDGIPRFQVFSCPDGQERIWLLNVERVSKSSDGKWILE